MQATPTTLEIPVFAGVSRNDRRLLERGIDGEFPTLNAKATAWRPLCGASRHGFEAAKGGNKPLVFRVAGHFPIWNQQERAQMRLLFSALWAPLQALLSWPQKKKPFFACLFQFMDILSQGCPTYIQVKGALHYAKRCQKNRKHG